MHRRRDSKSVESAVGARDVEEGGVWGLRRLGIAFIICLWFEMGAARISNKLEPSEVFLGPAFLVLLLVTAATNEVQLQLLLFVLLVLLTLRIHHHRHRQSQVAFAVWNSQEWYL